MSSYLYSRYIPPAKKPSASTFPAAKPSATAIVLGDPVPTPPPILQGSSPSYARYLPPPKTKAELPYPSIVPTINSTPSSKRNHEEVGDEPVPKRPKQEKQEKPSKHERMKHKKHGKQGNYSQENHSSSMEISKSKRSALRSKYPGEESTAGLQEHRDRNSTPSLGVTGTDGGNDATNSNMERQKNEPKSSEGRANTANISQSSGSSAKRSPHGLDTQKRKKKKRLTTESTAELDSEVGKDSKSGESRHKRLMEKREKSLKKANKLARKTTTESAGENAEVGPEEDIHTELHDLVPLPQPDPVSEPPILSTMLSLPSWLSSPIRVSPTVTKSFSEVGVEDYVAKILQRSGLNEAFAIQAAVLPILLPGKLHQLGDILVSAATGSGKTLAYVLPMIEDISRSQTACLRGLIIMPTRELVTQAKEVCEICASAFLGVSQRRRVKIGTAVGSETLKVEQNLLTRQELLYDPIEYENRELRTNAKWNFSDRESDEEICEEEKTSALPDHVFHPTSKVDILICTPGRLVEHIKSTPGFTLEKIKWLVVDEADKLLDQSFQQWLEVVMTGIDMNGSYKWPRDLVRKVVLSATMTRDIGLLNPLKLYRPQLVVLDGSGSMEELQRSPVSQAHVLPSLLLESAIKVEDENIKPLYLMELLKRENILVPSPIDDFCSASDSSEDDSSSNEHLSHVSEQLDREVMLKLISNKPRGVLIFTKSNESAVRLRRLISLLAPSSSRQLGTLTSTTPRASRKYTLKSFAAGKISILFASDLVSRGLDLPNLAHVVNYDIPTSLTSYIHRIGRTARAGKQGHAWTLYTGTEGRWFWNEIGRTEGVKRSSRKIDRVNMKADIFDEEQRRIYEEALKNLGREARKPRS